MGIDYSIVGKRFGRLVVKELDHVSENNRGTWWRCECDCGNEKVVYRGSLTSGDIVSCGCYRAEHITEYGRTHGLTKHPLYSVWSGMIQRCTNANAANNYRYGGRGITVYSPWKEDFKSFYDWAINAGYKEGLTLDRIDNDKGYCPENCRWANRIEQQNNTRRNHVFIYNGNTHTLAEWARILQVNPETLRCRLNRGDLRDFENYKEK